jgi:hypothetical protein
MFRFQRIRFVQLSERALVESYLAVSLLENHTALTGFYFRYGLRMKV